MQRLADHASGNRSSLLRVLGTEDDEVNRDTEVTKSFAEPHELRPAALQLRLDNQQIEIAVGATLSSRSGSEQDHLGFWRGCGQTAGSLCD